MKITYNEWISRINNQLERHQQHIRVLEYGKNYLKLSNNHVLTGKNLSKFKKRIFNKTTELWVKNIDKIFNGDIAESEIRSMLCRIGGEKCQKMHGDKTRKNLNTGIPWNIGLRGIPGHSQTEETKNKISIKNSGQNNGMYGHRWTTEEKTTMSNRMKGKILNGEFTPNSNNRNTHWESVYCGNKYRSSWEALYHYLNPLAEYEKLRINYTFNDNTHVYVVDFIDHVNNLVIEVKPEELCIGEKFTSKMTALQKWALENEYAVLIVNKKWLTEQVKLLEIDYSKFDEQTIRKIKLL